MQPANGSASPVECSVVIPTYCEADNLPALVSRLAASFRGAGLRGEIIIVDDNSPDDTEVVCAQLALNYPIRLLVRRTERGLSSAVLHGLSAAEGDDLVVMDADLSHPPEAVPTLLAALREPGTDFVIGSRYIQGGSTAEGWGFFRWLNSKAATLLAWPLSSAKDPMAGFFALRRRVYLAALELDPIGYKIGLELLVKCGCTGVKEIPIAFANRLHGESKLTFREQVNYLRHLLRLYGFRLRHARWIVRFTWIALAAVLLDLLSFAVLLRLLPLLGARTVALAGVVLFHYSVHCRLSLAPHDWTLPPRYSYSRWLAWPVGTLVNWLTSVGLLQCVLPLPTFPLIAAVGGILAGLLVAFLLEWFLVWQHSKGTS